MVCLYINGQVVDTLRNEGDGFYYSNITAQSGNQYEIKVVSEKFPEVSASENAEIVVCFRAEKRTVGPYVVSADIDVSGRCDGRRFL
jgi:hypothetical protein